jgi:hypothetical protein
MHREPSDKRGDADTITGCCPDAYVKNLEKLNVCAFEAIIYVHGVVPCVGIGNYRISPITSVSNAVSPFTAACRNSITAEAAS